LKGKKLIALFVSIGLALALVLSGCAAPEAEVVEKTVEKTVTETVEVEKTYRCLNPKGSFIPVELSPIAPRLDSLDGKRIFFYQSEATNFILPTLLARLKADHPTTTFDTTYSAGFGERTPTEEQLTYDALIRGVGW
jgi:hypothetical protein